MVRLYLLGFTHDLKGVVFSQRRGGKTASFWVPIDAAFMSAVDKLERARDDAAKAPKEAKTKSSKGIVSFKDLPAKPKVTLPPVGRSQARAGLPASEIQHLLRTGRSVQSVAAHAKTEIAWVERLAEPVLTERMGVVRLAQRAYMVRPRLGTSGLQLGDAVLRNLEERGTTEGLEEVWDARVGAAGAWRVSMRFSHRGKRRTAEWTFKKGSRSIAPRNRLASQIGWWAPDAPAPSEPLEGEDGEAPEAAPEAAKPKAKPRRRPASKARSKGKTKASARTSKTAKPGPARKKPAKRGARRPTTRRPASRRKR